MVSDTSNNSLAAGAVTGRKVSTVTTATVTGDRLYELESMDLAMKLHYLKCVYYFRRSDAIESITTPELKDPFFPVLDIYCEAAGRIRRDESGRPHIKCNDCGVRIVETKCELTVDDWLATKELDRYKHLVFDTVLGPNLQFSPLVAIQFTRFKCGGMAVGLSWPHVLGDAICASNYINLWGHLLAGKPKPCITSHLNPEDKTTIPANGNPPSVKQIESIGDFWLTPTNYQMVTASFQITETKLKQIQLKISSHIPTFEVISAVIWQSLGRIRVGKEPNLVNIVRNDPLVKRIRVTSNKPIISTVATDSSLAKLELSELAMLISNRGKDEKAAIEGMVEKETGAVDFVVYGANTTFVDMQDVDLYGLEMKGHNPVHVDYSINGVGDEGAVLVLHGARKSDGNGGRTVIVILPEDEIPKLREVLGSEWGIA